MNRYEGAYDVERFQAEYVKEFAKVPRYSFTSVPDLLFLLRMLGSDRRVTDIRWAAYILASIFLESSKTVKVTKQTKDKNGRLVPHQIKIWQNFKPIDETGKGKGRDYVHPAKVLKLPDGNARVTEYDGDQWMVSPRKKHPEKLKKGVKLGVGATSLVSPVYEADEGTPNLYYGRGYIQLTWWANYATAGFELGEGLKYLLEPSLVNNEAVAYELMILGMVKGKIFANGKKLSDYFNDTKCDYVGARNMVNPRAEQLEKEEMGRIAQRFEKVLRAASVG